jgi:hypothetical protein
MMMYMPRWILVVAGIAAVLGLTGCGANGVSDTILESCAKPPARPIGVAQTRLALQAEGVELPGRGDCRVPGGPIVAILESNTSASSVFCEIDKNPPPRTRGVPETIFQGPSSTGKAYSLVLANVECNVYTKNLVSAVRRAMARLGGRRTERW